MNHIKLLTLLFLLITSSVFSQSRSSIELSIQIGNSYRTFSNTPNTITNNKVIDSRNLHKYKPNYHLELGYNKVVTENIVLKSGINYSRIDYYTNKISDLRWPSEHDGNGGWQPDPTLPREFADQVNYTLIGIPLLFKYELNKNSLKPYVEIGPSFQFLANAQYIESTNLSSETTELSNELNSINLFGRVGIGISYQISARYEIFTAAQYRKQLNNFRKMNITENLYNYGLNVGIRLSMNKMPSDNIKGS